MPRSRVRVPSRTRTFSTDASRLTSAFDGEVLRRDRHDQRVRGDDGVDADERQARRAVENDQLVLMFEPLQ